MPSSIHPHYELSVWCLTPRSTIFQLYHGGISSLCCRLLNWAIFWQYIREKYTYKLPDFGNLDFKIWSWLKRGGITRVHGIVHLMAEILLARDADYINTFSQYNIFLWKWQVDSFAPIICRRIIWYWCAVILSFSVCTHKDWLIDWLVFNFFSDNNSSFMFERSI
jgi:hypothetical protein